MKNALYFCTECGAESLKGQGQCAACGAWNTLREVPADKDTQGPAAATPAAEIVRLSEVAA